MPEFYTIFARKNSFCPNLGGGGATALPAPLSYAYGWTTQILVPSNLQRVGMQYAPFAAKHTNTANDYYLEPFKVLFNDRDAPVRLSLSGVHIHHNVVNSRLRLQQAKKCTCYIDCFF